MGFDIEETKNLLSNFIEKLSISVNSDVIVIEGVLHFASYYDMNHNAFFAFSEFVDNKYYLQDKYNFRLTFSNDHNPLLTELEGKIERGNLNIPLADLHFPKNIACLGSPHKFYFYRTRNLTSQIVLEFFQVHIIPFFYSQTFYSKNNLWPWENLSHGITGLMEEFGKNPNDLLYLDIIFRLRRSTKLLEKTVEDRVRVSIKSKLKKQKIREHRHCICRSGRKFRNCHKDALTGLILFKNYLPKDSNLKKSFLLLIKS